MPLLVLAAETLTAARLNDVRALPQTPDLTLTARRAETLKARAYDGDIARVALPEDADLRWIKGIASPEDDLNQPMKGPLATARTGEADLHRAAVKLVKSAQLLPAALTVQLNDAGNFGVGTRG